MKRGRPPKPEGAAPVRALRLSDARYEKFRRLGGRVWLERMIDEAHDPASPSCIVRRVPGAKALVCTDDERHIYFGAPGKVRRLHEDETGGYWIMLDGKRIRARIVGEGSGG